MSVVTPITPEEEVKLKAQAAKENYIQRVLVGFDTFVNVLANGHNGETISARSSRAAAQGKTWGKAMCAFLNVFQKNHGPKAQAGDQVRAEIIAGLEEKSGNLPQ